MQRALIFALLVVTFAAAAYSAYLYSSLRRQAITTYYERQEKIEVEKKPSRPIAEKDIAEGIKDSVQALSAIVIVLVGGSLYLTLQKGRPRNIWDRFISYGIFPFGVCALAFSVLSGVAVLHAIVAARGTEAKVMTDASIQAYWDVQIELAIFGTMGVIVQLIDFVATSWSEGGR